MNKRCVRIKCNCEYCNNELALTPHVYNRAKKHFCNIVCRHAWDNINRTQVNCTCCNKKLLLSNYYLLRAGQHFCNSTCRKKWLKTQIHEVACTNCGKIITRNSFTLKRNKNNFCSKACCGTWYSKNINGVKHANWKGGRCTTTAGYIKVYKPGYPNSDSKGYILEHRYILEQKLGRPLKRKEVVHHLNGIKDDNREENLFLTTLGEHETNTIQKIYIARITQLESIVKGIYACPN